MVWAAPFPLLPARDFCHTDSPRLPLPGAGWEGKSREAVQRDRRWAFPSQGLGVLTGLSPLRAVPQSPGGTLQQSPVPGSFRRCCDLKTPLSQVSRCRGLKVQRQGFAKVHPFMAHKGLPTRPGASAAPRGEAPAPVGCPGSG